MGGVQEELILLVRPRQLSARGVTRNSLLRYSRIFVQGSIRGPVSTIPDSMTVGEALRVQNIAHGLPADGGEEDRWFSVHIGPFTIRLPNPPARQRVVFFHDTNHLLTGYDTVFSRGEMEIAAWEVASGCGPYWIAWLINLDMFALGLLVCPGKMFPAFVNGRRITTSMYCRRESRSTLAAMTVAGLRASIDLDQCQVTAVLADRIAFMLWTIVALTTILAPVLAVLLVFLPFSHS